MTRVPAVALLVSGLATVLIAPAPPAAGEGGPGEARRDGASAPAPAPDPRLSDAERRCDDLSDLLDRRAAELRGIAGADTLAVVEAEEIRRVADEILAEGDADLAADLFSEALALLSPPPGTP